MTEQDTPQGRPLNMGTPDRAQANPANGDEPPTSSEEAGGGGGGGRGAQLPPELRPRIVVRFASDEKDLLISGMLTGGRPLVNAPAVIDVPRGKGHVLLFANNPMWRSETQGDYFLIFNALLNFDHLSAGVSAAPAGRGGRGRRGGGQ